MRHHILCLHHGELALLRVDWSVVATLVKKGVPMSAQMLVLSLSGVLMITLVNDSRTISTISGDEDSGSTPIVTHGPGVSIGAPGNNGQRSDGWNCPNVRPEPVVLVGHSLGGLTIPLVAAARPVERMVFLAAFIPKPGQAFKDQYATEEGMFPPSPESHRPIEDKKTGLSTWPAERAIPSLFTDVRDDLAQESALRLRRQSSTPHAEVCPLKSWPNVPSSYILCLDDALVGAAWARRAARERLDTKAIELPGGHMPMISRPDELAAALDACLAGEQRRMRRA